MPPAEQPWGLISLDWSVARSIWQKPDFNQSNMEATAAENARRIKAVSPGTRVFLYHNMELALQWVESQRKVMYDSSKADWFLQYTDAQGRKTGHIYNEPLGDVGTGDQYFWDFRNPDASDYYVSSIIRSLGDDLDGTFTDDVSGLPEEHVDAPSMMGLSDEAVKDIQAATLHTSQKLIDALIAAGKYNWQAFTVGDNVGDGPTRNNCAVWMRARCNDDFQTKTVAVAMTRNQDDAKQTVAGFLVVRSPYSWLGWGWESDQKDWSPLFNMDVGHPVGTCFEESAGVFSRSWSNGIAKLDCNSWTASLPFM